MHTQLEPLDNMAAHHAHIISSAPDAILSISLSGIITSWNESAERLFGYTSAEIIGKHFSKLTDREIIPLERQTAGIVHEAYRDRLSTRLHKDGRDIPVTITAALLRGPDGDVTGCAEFLRDGHCRLSSPAREQQREPFTPRVLDTLFAFVAILAPDGTFLEVNRAPLEAANILAADVIGRKVWDSHWCNNVPDVQAQIISAYTEAAAGKTVRFDVPIRLADDQTIWIDFQLAPLRNDDGEITHLIGCAVDLSRRKQVEERLRQNYLTYLTLIETAPFGVYLIDSRFKMAQVSQGAKKAFAKCDPLLGRDFAEIMHSMWPKELATKIVQHFRRTLQTGLSYRAPSLVVTRADSGEVEAYDWQIDRVVLPDTTFGVVCYFYDLTARQHHEEQVHQLMYEVAHRSKNLLGVVQSIARQTVVSNPQDFMTRFSERLQSLSWSQDLLIANDWRSVGLNDLVRAQLAHVSGLIGTRIAVSGPPIQLMSATAQGIGMALHELATNASKYGALSNETGRVTLTWALEGNEFSIHWSEQGGPAVSPPNRRGFGYSVISNLVEASVAGQVTLDFEATGLMWTLRCAAANAVESRWS